MAKLPTHTNSLRPNLPKRLGVAIAFTVGSLAVIAPVFTSVYLAWRESIATARSLNLTYTQDMLRRLEETANQFANGLNMANKAGYPLCSDQDIELLRNIDLGSNYIQAAGRISGDTLLCTSVWGKQSVELGHPSLKSSRGVAEYYHRTVFPGQLRPLNVFAARQFAILVDPNLAVDIPTEGPGVELAAFVPSAPDREPLASIGNHISAAWFRDLKPGSELTTLEHGYLVTRQRSAHWDLAVISATPTRYIYGRVGHFALILVPLGIACGIMLIWALKYFGRIRTSFPALIRAACRNNEFHLEYQPIVDLGTRTIIGAEALVRWRSRFGELKPDHFIPLAEEQGLISLITHAVLNQIAADLPRILKLNPDFRISINVSAADLQTPSLMERVYELLAHSGASPKNIEIEATERAALHDKETVALVHQFRQNGFGVSLDDFGTGYSSLSCLQSLALDTLKIDKTFVETIGTGGPTSQVILHIIEMGHSLKLALVAEGVETEAQAEFLAKQGVPFAQGWLFGTPLHVNQLLKEIENRVPTSGDDASRTFHGLAAKKFDTVI